MTMNFPKKWRHVKVDLFDNASEEKQHILEHEFKLSLSIVLDSNISRQYRASMKSQKNNRFVSRGVEDIYDTDPHYQLVHNTRQQLSGKNISHWVSKFYRSGAKSEGTVPGLTGFICDTGSEFVALIIFETDIFEISFHKDLTDNQRQGKIVGTFLWGAEQENTRPRTRASEEL